MPSSGHELECEQYCIFLAIYHDPNSCQQTCARQLVQVGCIYCCTVHVRYLHVNVKYQLGVQYTQVLVVQYRYHMYEYEV